MTIASALDFLLTTFGFPPTHLDAFSSRYSHYAKCSTTCIYRGLTRLGNCSAPSLFSTNVSCFLPFYAREMREWLTDAMQ